MLTPDQLEALPRRFVQLWQQVEDDILQDIARRIKTLDELDPLTPTAAWQAWRLAETRAVRSNTAATLARYTGKSRAEIKRLLETAGAQTLAADDAVYTAAGLDPPPVNQSPALLNLLNAGYRQTCGTWQNLTATTANTVTGVFEDRLSRAWGLVSTGAMDYNTAIRRTVDDLADTMPYITYPSGHTDTLEVAARRAVLTGVNQTCAKLQLARMEEMDCEFVEVTAHEGARPTHAVWQGRVYHRGGAVVQGGERYEDFEAATGYGTGPGLCGWNCRHNFYPFYPGISVRNYTDERLAELDARNIPYGGGLYTKYEITQMQRALERKVRKHKRRYLAETAAGVDSTDTAVKLRTARKELKDFVQATSGRNDSARADVAGFGHSQARRATAVARQQEQLDAVNAELNQLRQDGIIKSKGSFVLPPAAPDTLVFERYHVFQRIAERGMSFTDAEKIISSSRFALRQQDGKVHAYYSTEGFVAVRADGMVYSMGRLDDGGKKLMEVAEKHGF